MPRRIRKLRPHTEITLIVNGFTVACRVRDIRTQAGMDCVAEINTKLAAGDQFIGYGSRFGDHNIQINWG